MSVFAPENCAEIPFLCKNSILIQSIIIKLSVQCVKRFYLLSEFFKLRVTLDGNNEKAAVMEQLEMRIDKFLKVSRILKRRTLAQQACDKGKVIVNGREVKPAHRVKVGDEVELQFTGGALKFKILKLKETVKKDEAQTLYEITE